MPLDRTRKIAVFGAGLMGHRIGQVFASGGYRVALTDVSSEKLQQALRTVEQNLRMLAGFGVLTEERIGAKSGRGFYEWTPGRTEEVKKRVAASQSRG